jgi:hypothetical protein
MAFIDASTSGAGFALESAEDHFASSSKVLKNTLKPDVPPMVAEKTRRPRGTSASTM